MKIAFSPLFFEKRCCARPVPICTKSTNFSTRQLGLRVVVDVEDHSYSCSVEQFRKTVSKKKRAATFALNKNLPLNEKNFAQFCAGGIFIYSVQKYNILTIEDSKNLKLRCPFPSKTNQHFR